MACDVAVAFATDGIVVDATPMKIGREQSIVILRRPICSLIDHQAGMGMSSASGIGARRHAIFAFDSVMRLTLIPMKMIGGLFDWDRLLLHSLFFI